MPTVPYTVTAVQVTAVSRMAKGPRRYGMGFDRIPYTGGILEDSDLSWVRFVVKTLYLINCTHHMAKRIGLHLILAYPYSTRINTAVKM